MFCFLFKFVGFSVLKLFKKIIRNNALVSLFFQLHIHDFNIHLNRKKYTVMGNRQKIKKSFLRHFFRKKYLTATYTHTKYLKKQ